MTAVVKFNVGGQSYQVSRSFLDLHPHTILAKCASKRWQKDPEFEIFIDRDGEMFRHVLSYLRDGRVKLPLTVTQEGLLLELDYYGVEGVDKKDIATQDYTAARTHKFYDYLLAIGISVGFIKLME